MHAVFVILAAAAISGQPAARVAPDTPAAEHTRTKYLKAKVEGEFKDAALRDVLKEFAHQVDTQLEHPVMWTYADAKAGNLKVTFSCKNKTLEDVLDDLCTKLKLGYFVISDAQHPRDGWVRITMGTERGIGSLGPKAEPKPGDEDEEKAALRLKVAKQQLDKGNAATAKAVLKKLVDLVPKTKAAAEAKSLLEKLDK